MPIQIPANFSLDAYCRRINYVGKLKPDLETLNAIVFNHVRNIAFENLDVVARKIVSINPEEICDKILNSHRGGYCYEVNGLFSFALAAIGFEFQYVFARPMYYPMARPKTHMAIVVTLCGEKYLCDMGFGSSGPRLPLLLDSDAARDGYEITQECETFRLSIIERNHFLLEALVNGEFLKQYSFDLYEAEWIDFEPANYLNSTHPDSAFLRGAIVVKITDGGRKIIRGGVFKTIENGKVNERVFAPNELDDVLSQEFGLKIKE